MDRLTASSSIVGHRNVLSLTLTGVTPRPRIRVVRRLIGYAESPDDGFIVFDSADLLDEGTPSAWSIPFTSSGLAWDHVQPWGRIERETYLLTNAVSDGGLRQAEMTSFFTTSGDTNPSRATVSIYDRVSDTTVSDIFPNAVQRVITAGAVELFDSNHASLGKMLIPALPGPLTWARTGATPIVAGYTLHKSWVTTGAQDIGKPAHLRVSFVTTQGGARRLAGAFEQTLNPDTGDVLRTITIEDTADLKPQTVYYYSVYVLTPGASTWSAPRELRASVMATGTFGMRDRLYALLPAVHRYYDEPTPALAGAGQLRRFLQVVGAGLDQARSLSEGMRNSQDLLNVRVEQVPHLGSWIGWPVDQTLSSVRQRMDVLSAPELYSTIGTIPNLKRIVERETGWLCEVKEFVHNVFMTNASEILHIWELWQLTGNIGVSSNGEPSFAGGGGVLHQETHAPPGVRTWFDGRPAVAVDINGVAWLFWHSTRSGRREIWCRKVSDTVEFRPLANVPIDSPNDDWSDSSPAVVLWNGKLWLFWDSDRAGTRDIWAWLFDPMFVPPPVPDPDVMPTRVTSHTADDRNPAVVVQSNVLWLFWQSNRRGPTDIWGLTAAVSSGVLTWSPPGRITKSVHLDLTPAAILDLDGQIRLFWSSDTGDRASIHTSVFAGGSWSMPQMLPESASPSNVPPGYDESPAPVVLSAVSGVRPACLLLLWNSNRDGRKKLWWRTLVGTTWSAMRAASGTGGALSLEPMLLFDSSFGTVHFFFRSTRNEANFRSRTFTDEPEARKRGQPDDRWHYLYDTARGKDNWYARDTVGFYLTPPQGVLITSEALLKKKIEINERVKLVVDPFRPLQVRFVWFVKTSSGSDLASWDSV